MRASFSLSCANFFYRPVRFSATRPGPDKGWHHALAARRLGVPLPRARGRRAARSLGAAAPGLAFQAVTAEAVAARLRATSMTFSKSMEVVKVPPRSFLMKASPLVVLLHLPEALLGVIDA